MNTPSTQGAQSAPSSDRISPKVICAFISAGLLSFSGVIVETATNVTFPTLMNEFGVSTERVQWMTTIYLLVVSIMVPLSASFKARFRSKSLFIAANLFFIVGLILDIAAQNFPMLLAGRVVQGLGTGIALPLMFNIILEQVPARKIGTMMGMGTLITAIAPAIGPTFGGLVVTSMGWRYVFVFILPILVISLIMGVLSIEQKSELRKVHFDLLSLVFIALTFGGLIYGFSSMTTRSFLSLHVAGAMLVGVVACVCFVMRQLKSSNPILDLRTLSNLNFAGFILTFFLVQIASLGLSFILPNYMQLVNGSSALTSGLIVLPGALLGAAFAPLGGRILDTLGPKPPLMTGPALTIVSMVLFFVFGKNLGNGGICALYLLYMAGMGMSYGNIMTTGLSQLSRQMQSHGNALFNTVQQFAGAVGTSVCAALVAAGQAGASSKAVGTANGSTLAFGVLVVVLVIEYLTIIKVLLKPFPAAGDALEN
ncbi:MFS transporter [Bombiscardovia apis]|uniref:MFS transporter n=1 Tax=Bombiscardovia apis TaxID=2932182 RepID=A0ABN6SDE1_9BIFI|nr:DHA2 family efflux MFS transporter permease subunit [Bombiscardovia apis]BDR54087.1 MFS transporter [Bombiscardovia apis]